MTVNDIQEEITVIVTCHNEENYIEDSIKSILRQSIYRLIKEIIVVIDNSTDNSINIVKAYEKKFPKFKVLDVNFKSLSKSRNFGILHSSGKYIAILDGDDYWHEKKLELQLINFKLLDQSYGLIYTNFVDFKNQNLSQRKNIKVKSFNNINNQIINYFCKDGPIVPSTVLIKSEVFSKIGKFDENLKYYEDTDFYLRLLEKFKIYHIDDFLCFKRRHENQITNKLSNLILHGDKVVEKSIKRNPDLIKYQDVRKSRNRIKAAINEIYYYNNRKKALYLIRDSIKYNIFNYSSLLSLIFLLLPKKMNNYIINIFRKFN